MPMLLSPYVLQLIDQCSQHTIHLPHLSYPLSINIHNSLCLLVMGHCDNKELQTTTTTTTTKKQQQQLP